MSSSSATYMTGILFIHLSFAGPIGTGSYQGIRHYLILKRSWRGAAAV